MNARKPVTAIENLGNGNIVDDDRNVRTGDDITVDGLPMSNEGRIARMHPHLDPEALETQGEDRDDVRTSVGALASGLSLSEMAREQAGLTVVGFVGALTAEQRADVQKVISHFHESRQEISESQKPRIRFGTRQDHLANAGKASAAGKKLLEELTGTSSNPLDDDKFLQFGGWKRFIMDNQGAILDAIHRLEDPSDTEAKERDDDLGITRW